MMMSSTHHNITKPFTIFGFSLSYAFISQNVFNFHFSKVNKNIYHFSMNKIISIFHKIMKFQKFTKLRNLGKFKTLNIFKGRFTNTLKGLFMDYYSKLKVLFINLYTLVQQSL